MRCVCHELKNWAGGGLDQGGKETLCQKEICEKIEAYCAF